MSQEIKSLFITDVEESTTEGIFKKIAAQVEALSTYGICDHVFHKKNKIYLRRVCDRKIIYESCESEIIAGNYKLNLSLIKFSTKKIMDGDYNLVYYRHSLRPSIQLKKMIDECNKTKTYIFTEFPTYPYFYEQVYDSDHKLVTFSKMLTDYLFWTRFRRKIDTIVAIMSNYSVKHYSNMFFINNAVNPANIIVKKKLPKANEYNILGLGTICKYHGYDRVINSIKACNGYLKDGRKIIFHVVGNSDTIDNLKSKAKQFGIEDHIVFYGKKYSSELDEIFEKMNIAVGCLALYRRHANIDTTLKVAEYICRGIPYVTSGDSPKLSIDNKLAYKIKNDDSDINFDVIDKYFDCLSDEMRYAIANQAIKELNWNYNIKKIITECYLCRGI